MRSLSSSAALLRGICGFDGLRVMRESAATAVELESDPASPWYAMARGALGFSLYLSGAPEAAAASLAEAAHSQASYPLTRMFSLSVLSLVAVELGRLPEAQEAADAARVLGRPRWSRRGAAEFPGLHGNGRGPCRARLPGGGAQPS